jgi:CIC family chloride channel protein
MLAGLIFLFPTLFGEGYESIKVLAGEKPQEILSNTILSKHIDNQWVLLLFVSGAALMKALAAGLTMGSGGNGGNFAPSLFVGSYLGFSLSHLLTLLGLKEIPIHNFTVVGMAGVLSGLFHAPLTAIFLIAEITGGYGLVVPLLIVSSISFAISKRMEKYSMDIKSIAKTGMVFTSDKDFNILSTISIKNYIQKDLRVLTLHNTTQDAFEIFSQTTQSFIPVVNQENEIVGSVELDKVRPIIFNSFQTKFTLLKDIIVPPAIALSTDSAKTVMDLFESYHSNYLLIEKNGKYLGSLSKYDILEAYRRNHKYLLLD